MFELLNTLSDKRDWLWTIMRLTFSKVFVMWIRHFWQMLIILLWLPNWLTYSTTGSVCS